MALGFELLQRLSGSYHLLSTPGVDHPVTATITLRVHDLPRFLLDRTAEATGEMDAEGLADHRPLRGTVEIKPIDRALVYDFRFPVDGARELRFHGTAEVAIDPTRVVDSMTTVAGSIFDEDVEVGRAVLRFEVRTDLLKLLRSIRAR